MYICMSLCIRNYSGIWAKTSYSNNNNNNNNVNTIVESYDYCRFDRLLAATSPRPHTIPAVLEINYFVHFIFIILYTYVHI